MLLDPKLIFDVAAENYEKSAPNKDLFEYFIREDSRVKSLSPVLVLMLIRAAMILFSIWMASGTNRPTKLEDKTLPGQVGEYLAECSSPETDSEELKTV